MKPRDHDACDPEAGADAAQEEVLAGRRARSEEEDSRAGAVDGVAEVQLALDVRTAKPTLTRST